LHNRNFLFNIKRLIIKHLQKLCIFRLVVRAQPERTTGPGNLGSGCAKKAKLCKSCAKVVQFFSSLPSFFFFCNLLIFNLLPNNISAKMAPVFPAFWPRLCSCATLGGSPNFYRLKRQRTRYARRALFLAVNFDLGARGSGEIGRAPISKVVWPSRGHGLFWPA